MTGHGDRDVQPARWTRNLLWIDGSAALLVGMLVLVLREFLAKLYALPLDILTLTGVVNAVYATQGLSLAPLKSKPRARIALLIVTN